MNCKDCREIIITDYADEEISREVLEAINEHMAGCGACLEYKNTLIKNLLEPFQNLSKSEVPDEVWQKIKTNILQKREERHSNMGTALRTLLTLPRMAVVSVFAAAAIVMIFLLNSGNNGNNLTVANEYQSYSTITNQESDNYFAYLYDDSYYEAEAGVQFGTSVEELLL